MPNLNIYISYTESWTPDHEVEIKYRPGIRGLENMFVQTRNVVIDSPEDTGNAIFENISSAWQFYVSTACATVQADVENYNGETYDDFNVTHVMPETFDEIQITNGEVSSLNSRVTFAENSITDGLAAINLALSDHENDTGAHPNLTAPLYTALDGKQNADAILDELVAGVYSTDEFVTKTSSGFSTTPTGTAGKTMVACEDLEDIQDMLALEMAHIDGLETEISALNTALSGKANSTHTHIATDITDSTTVGRSVLTAANAGAARTAIGAGTSSFSGSYVDLTNKPTIPTLPIAISDVTSLQTSLDAKVPSTRTIAGKALSSDITLVANDISNATTVGKNILTASTASGVRGVIFSAATHINDAATNAATDAATNAPNNAPTNLNVLTTLVGALTGEVNATNQRQNQIADIVNANAVKQNAGFTLLNAFATKFNLSLDILENNGLMAA